MKKRYLLVLALALLAAIPAVVFAGPPGGLTGSAHLHPANGSGVNGAVINFVDNGVGKMTITGTATGLQAGWFSLLYDNGSVPGGPGTPQAPANIHGGGNCEPTNDDLSAEQMLLDFGLDFPFAVAVWQFVGGDNWELFYEAEGDFYAPLSDLGTVSIRSTIPGPENVEACGKITNKP